MCRAVAVNFIVLFFFVIIASSLTVCFLRRIRTRDDSGFLEHFEGELAHHSGGDLLSGGST